MFVKIKTTTFDPDHTDRLVFLATNMRKEIRQIQIDCQFYVFQNMGALVSVICNFLISKAFFSPHISTFVIINVVFANTVAI